MNFFTELTYEGILLIGGKISKGQTGLELREGKATCV